MFFFKVLKNGGSVSDSSRIEITSFSIGSPLDVGIFNRQHNQLYSLGKTRMISLQRSSCMGLDLVSKM